MQNGDPEYEARVGAIRERLIAAQTRIRREGAVAYAITIGGDDRRGVHRLTNKLFEWMDARSMDACVHGRPRGDARDLPPLFRMWRDCPAKGRGAIFVRPASNQILVDRVRGRTKRKQFESQLEQMHRMEATWAREGIKVVKLWLTVSAKVHRQRRETRTDLDRWRQKQYDRSIVKDLEEGGEIAAAIRERTDHPDGQWHVFDGSAPKERDLAAAEAVAVALEEAAAGDVCKGEQPKVPDISAKTERRVEALFDDGNLVREAPDEEEYHDRLRRLRDQITERALAALEDERSTVVVLQGWDAAGKGGVIRRALPALDPGFYRVVSTAAPNEVERRYPYLWRFWRDLPQPGNLRFFDRSWYGRVLVERIEGFATEAEWRRAYDEIVDFERQLVDSGIHLAKVWLEISDEEQLRRFEAREATPEKRYKITEEDWRNREKRPQYEAAVREMIARTDRDWGPWHVVSSENKRAARLRFLEILRDTLG
ncbi:MAG: polyphosphate:AMP phosphotransferase [Planctomycetota bacterium]